MDAARPCQCGTSMSVRAGGILWCAHCDEPHRPMGPREVCSLCKGANASPGIGPRTT